MKTKQPQITRIMFPGTSPNKCGDIRTGVYGIFTKREEESSCKNEAKYYVRGELQGSGMFYDLHCYCEGCLNEKHPNWKSIIKGGNR